MKVNKQLIEDSIQLAESWQKLAESRVSRFDHRFHIKMRKMLAHPKDKVLLMQLMDQCFRSKNPERIAGQIVYLLNKHGMAEFFAPSDRILLSFFKNIGVLVPSVSVPLFVRQMREDSRTVVIKGEPLPFNQHLKKRQNQNIDCIVNLIGEIVLGEKEAEARLQKYLTALADPHIELLSIKLSTLSSQLNSLDMDGTVGELVPRLSQLFDQALTHPTREGVSKFINLDMEEYRDLEITIRVFEEVLDNPKFQQMRAGIALQAYLPDSHEWQKRITQWAINRVKNGGAPIKIRLVKGANMEMESTEAAIRGWELVTYREKLDTDANYKRMATYALQPEHAVAAHLGTASHNLFEQAWAVCLAKSLGTAQFHTLEMLEGMNESARQAIHELTQPVILYAPSSKRQQFTNAIAYLVRRLDENTGPDNFIRYSFGLKVGSKDWELQKQVFRDCFDRTDSAKKGPYREQNRLQETTDLSMGAMTKDQSYRSEADTDFTLPSNREWAQNIRKKWKKSAKDTPGQLPVVVAGQETHLDRDHREVIDYSQLPEKVTIARCAQATISDIDLAVQTAKADPDGWRSLTASERSYQLRKVAQKVRQRRGDLIGVAAAELGKAFIETDVEVSEAVDFLEYYALSAKQWDQVVGLNAQGKGVGLVVPPWNFPIAIPLGGVAAALASGNTVILKPASSAIYCAWELCKCFWEAGISKNTLQLLPCPGSIAGKHLIPNTDIDFVILTGGESTAQQMLEARHDLFLTAETGGKDATIVTALSDREQAIRNVCQSAFSNSGQKCSATSLLILEKEVFEDESFKSALIDAASSMKVGPPWNFESRITLLESKASGPLKQALETLEEGESWALEPGYVNDNPYLLKPSIKWGVKPGSFCHMTELFGPVLSVMCAENLDHAIELVNATGYGLTSGIESLDEREVEQWKSRIRAGNLYINRGTTGAIVLRQPFGGMGKSSIGAGRKVGIYNYITQFMDFTCEQDCEVQHSTPMRTGMLKSSVLDFLEPNPEILAKHLSQDQVNCLKKAAKSFAVAFETEFSKTHDPFQIRGEHNQFRYCPVDTVCLRAEKGYDPAKLWLRILGAATAGVCFDVRFEENNQWLDLLRSMRSHFPKLRSIEITSDAQLSHYIGEYSRILYCDPSRVSPSVYQSASKSLVFICRQSPLIEGRLELLNYFDEQAISHSYHRYGNIAAEGTKKNE